MLLLALGCAALTLAQSADVTTAPPKIAFDPWEPAGEDAQATRYLQRFPSAVPSGIAMNDTVYLDVLLPVRTSGPVPAVLILHYWGATDLRVEVNMAHRLNRQGIAGVILTLPFHLRRTPPGSRTGAMAVSSDPQAMIRTMVQSVADVRRAVDWIQSRTEFQPQPIGLTGTSLGALVAGLAVGVEPRFEHAAFMLGGADLAHIIWNSSRVVKERDEMRRNGYTEEKLRQTLKPIEPLEFLPGSSLKSSFVIAAQFDTVVPPADAEKLAGALKNPKELWLDSGHYGGFIVQKQVQGAIANYFAAGFKGLDYTPPKRVSAPIVRFGMQANAETSMQVVLGMDVWRWNARNDAFATVLATARGPQLFLGVTASRGLSVGVAMLSGKVSPGFMWSLVL